MALICRPGMPARTAKRKPAVAGAGSGEASPAKQVARQQFWLIKSEPESRLEKGVEMKFSFDDLKAEPNSTACWDGVRNYSARNHMRAMKVRMPTTYFHLLSSQVGQRSFFYHSNVKEPGIVGLVEIVREAYTDHTQFDPKDPHFDPRSKKVSSIKAFCKLIKSKRRHAGGSQVVDG